jgi:hypothetical protein
MNRRADHKTLARLLTFDQAQEVLGGISREAFNDHVRSGVRVVMIGRRPFVDRLSLERWVDDAGWCSNERR